jgi:hypothetical protein
MVWGCLQLTGSWQALVRQMCATVLEERASSASPQHKGNGCSWVMLHHPGPSSTKAGCFHAVLMSTSPVPAMQTCAHGARLQVMDVGIWVAGTVPALTASAIWHRGHGHTTARSVVRGVACLTCLALLLHPCP